MAGATHTYFRAEKREGVVFMGAGMLALTTAASLALSGKPFGLGMSIPLGAVGLIELAAGLVVFTRTDAQTARLDAQRAASPAAFRDAELPRMRRVNTEFAALAVTELVFILAGGALAGYGFVEHREVFQGVGLGLGIQGAVMLTLDMVAADRARTYTHALASFVPTPVGTELRWTVLGGTF